MEMLTNYHQVGMGALMSDGAGENMSDEVTKFLKENNIARNLSAPGRPAQNGTAESANRVIAERVRATMSHADADDNLWGEVLDCAAHVHNDTPQRRLGGKTPN